jgi:peptidoglycan/LPS O-acetylase OafA/YrhL
MGSLYFGWFYYAKPFILPPLILLIGVNGFRPVVNWVNQLGDISYGIYIYSFPIQQILEHYFHFSALQLMAPSLLLAAVAGYASWHLIEKGTLGR